MAQVCWECGEELSRYHTGYICRACQKGRLGKMRDDNKDWVDAQGYADILGLDSAEQLKRLARKGVLAPRIPHVKQWRWYKKDIEARIKQEQRKEDVFRETALGIANNLRVCSNDVVLRAMSYTVGNKVYGRNYALKTNDAARIYEIELVEVDRSIALKLLEELPKKDFPELEGLTDWEDFLYERINNNLLIRLESYF